MRTKMGVILLVICIIILAACTPGKNPKETVIKLGFSFSNESSESTPWISIAMECNQKQNTLAELIIHIGHEKGFIENWNKNVWNSNPGYVKFVVARLILDDNRNRFSQKYFDLDNFGDDKYLKFHNYDDRIPNKVVSVEYAYNFKDVIDFNDIDIERGYIQYKFCLVDDNYQIITEMLNFGVSTYAHVGFTVDGASVTISEWDGF